MILPSCGCAADKVKEICWEKIFVYIKVVFDPIHNLLEDHELGEAADAPSVCAAVSNGGNDGRSVHKLTQG